MCCSRSSAAHPDERCAALGLAEDVVSLRASPSYDFFGTSPVDWLTLRILEMLISADTALATLAGVAESGCALGTRGVSTMLSWPPSWLVAAVESVVHGWV